MVMNLKPEKVDGHGVVFNLTGPRNADQAARVQIGLDPIRVLIVDEHRLVRAGIRWLLERLSDVEVIAEARDGPEALCLVDKYDPAIVIMDLAIRHVNGLEVIERLSKSHPNLKVIILSIYSDEESVEQALRAGASGYLVRGMSIEELEVAIRSVDRGESYISPQVSKPIIAEYLRRTIAPGSDQILTARQNQVLKLIAEGEATKQIALHLNVSVKTVETHRALLMERLNIHDVPGLVRYAIRKGLISID